MTRALPAHPHPDHLRRQARELLRAWHAGDASALVRAAAWRLHPPWQLATAQLVLAREHGCTSWPALMADVEARRIAGADEARFVAEVVALAIGHGWHAPQPARAADLMSRRSSRQPALALLRGEAADPRPAPGAGLAPWNAPPLVYAAASGLARLEGHRAALVATVERLLADGADPNARWHDPDPPGHALPVLYGAVARARCLPIVERLLAAGADPNDNESLYHAMEQTGAPMLDALIDAGARWTGTNALLRQLDHDDLAGLRRALARGADPNERGPGGRAALHHALLRGRGADSVRLLLDQGADPQAPDDQGYTPAQYALRAGARDALALLHAQGNAPALAPEFAFAAACAAGDEAVAWAHLAGHPDAVRNLPPHLLRLLPEQAQRGRHEAVALMLALGWPVAVTGDWDASALNQAAFRGDAAMVRLLLGHGAQWSERNGYGGDALGSCLHAALNEPVPGGDYAAVLALLLDAGAPAPRDPDALPDELRDVIEART